MIDLISKEAAIAAIDDYAEKIEARFPAEYDCGVQQGLECADMILSAMPSAWTPIEHGAPKVNGKYIVSCKSRDGEQWKMTCECEYSIELCRFNISDSVEVEAWMEYPLPYRGEK